MAGELWWVRIRQAGLLVRSALEGFPRLGRIRSKESSMIPTSTGSSSMLWTVYTCSVCFETAKDA